MTLLASAFVYLAGLVLAPGLPGIVNRVKAAMAGRKGVPTLQLYADLAKLLRKGAVYSRTTTWVFRFGPVAGLAAVLVALALVPAGGVAAPVSFSGDLILFAGLFAVMRMATMLAALDTGSSFEGMGASREAAFAVFAEPALLVALAAIVRVTDSLSLSGAAAAAGSGLWGHAAAPVSLACAALFVVLLAENARVPVDDPNTHLELTMIHEVMVLDHGGPDFALIQYASALKLWAGSALIVSLLPCRTGNPWIDPVIFLAGMAGAGVLVGLVESFLARLKMSRVPHMLVGAMALAILALVMGRTGRG
ncbi:MAG: NADH-quinone oxidoreductase subunit H [Candidatus Coatesbacteria bacterium]